MGATDLTCDQLEGFKPIHSFPTFQNAELTVDEYSHKRSKYMCKLDFKDAYLCVPLSQDDQKRVMGKNPVPVSLPVLWPRTNPICFHKTPKDPYGPFKKVKDMYSKLFGRHVDY